MMAFDAILLAPSNLDEDSKAPARSPVDDIVGRPISGRPCGLTEGSWAFERAIIRHQRKRIAAAIEGEPRLFSWLVARVFTGKPYQKRSMLQQLLPGPYVGFEPQ